MSRFHRLRAIILPTILLLVGLGVGFVLGSRRKFSGIMKIVAAGGTVTLNREAEVLCRLREGDVAGAIKRTEMALDLGAGALPQGEPWSALSHDQQRALTLAKIYRSAYPPANSDDPGTKSIVAQAQKVFEAMPPLPNEVTFCSKELNEIYSRTLLKAHEAIR